MRSFQYYGHSRADYMVCKKTIWINNQQTLRRLLRMASIALLFLAAASFVLSFLVPYRGLYLAAAVLIFALATAEKRLPFLKTRGILGAYLLMAILYGFGIALNILQQDQTASVFNLLLVLLPMFFIDNFLRMSLYTVLASCVLCTVVYQTRLPLAAARAIFSCLCHCALSIIAHFYINYRMVGGMIRDCKRNDALLSYQKATHKLRAQMQRDPLTGLYNRGAFIELAVLQLEQCREQGRHSALGIMDLDHFKSINDTCGHQMGDRVLADVAAILQKTLRGSDLVGRLGGDEYIFFLTDIADLQALPAILNRLLERVSQLGQAKEIRLHASVGLILSTDTQDSFEILYHKADLALYDAKNTGRNRYIVYQ